MPISDTIPLWSDSHGTCDGDRPRLEAYLPASPGRRRAAIVICPGGAYAKLAPHEGGPFAELFASHGIASFVLTYRVAPNRFPAGYADATRAIRLLRHRADDLGIDPDRIGIMGFSAGGHLAATVATQPDLYRDPADDLAGRVPARPNRVILGYPVISMTSHAHVGCIRNLLGEDAPADQRRQMSNELHVSAANPPAFIFHTADDPGVLVQNALMFAAGCAQHRVGCELHVFEHGPHGVGMAADDPKLAVWTKLLLNWLTEWQEAADRAVCSSSGGKQQSEHP
jgi:acetyl esterase/lipase